MSFIKRCILLNLFISILAVSVVADDIGWIKLDNKFQEKVVQGIIDKAYSRVENKFLVSYDEQQKKYLSNAKIEFEDILTDINIEDYYIIYPHHKDPDNFTKIDDVIGYTELGSGVLLSDMSGYKAESLRELTGYRAVPLADKNVRILYVSPMFKNPIFESLDFPTDTLIDLISFDSLYSYVTTLEAFQTRYIWSDSINSARNWIKNKFLSWGYTNVTTPSFYYNGSWHYNVMAYKQGYAEPDKVIVIGGHYDSITYGQSQGPLIYAPGADDNASGTVIAMECARVLANFPTRKTIIFMAFSAEEVGLVGSRDAAYDLAYTGTDIEVMFNYDMVAHNPDPSWYLNVNVDPLNPAYSHVSADAAFRLTNIYPLLTGMGGSSDHVSFLEQGYSVVNNIETDFNDIGWHTELDISSRLNFGYFYDVAKIALASLAIVANSAHPTTILDIIDQGNGQSLEIFWSDCDINYDYTIYVGTSSGNYSLVYNVPSGQCSYTIDGLTDGQTYYISVVGSVTDGYPAVSVFEETGTSYVIPRTPALFNAEPELHSTLLTWLENREADFSHYRIYRDDGSGFILFEDNLTTTSYQDYNVSSSVTYSYKITAVDFDGYESELSQSSAAIPAFFDNGILIADEFNSIAPMPSQTIQIDYFDYIMGGAEYNIKDISNSVDLDRNTAGQYSSILWFDDDFNEKLIENSEDSIAWYLNYTNNMLLSGYRLIGFWTGSNVPYGHILRNEFGLISSTESVGNDFIGAVGQNGWPSVQVDPTGLLGGKLPFIYILNTVAGAEVIYTFDSFTDNPAYEGLPCGIVYNTPKGKRILLGFPLYFLYRNDVRSLIGRVKVEFGEGIEFTPGDLDGNPGIDIGDIVYLVDYMFNQGPPPLNMNAADVDASCELDIADLVYLVEFQFDEPPGPEPLPGCIY